MDTLGEKCRGTATNRNGAYINKRVMLKNRSQSFWHLIRGPSTASCSY